MPDVISFYHNTNKPVQIKRESNGIIPFKYKVVLRKRELVCTYRVFTRDVVEAMLVSINKETVAMLVSQTNPQGLSSILTETLAFVSVEKLGN